MSFKKNGKKKITIFWQNTYPIVRSVGNICYLVKVQTIKSSPLILLSLKDKQIEDKKDIEIPTENNEDNIVEKVVKQKRTKKNFQCKECNKSFRDNYKLKRHEKVHMKMKLPEKTLDGQNLGEAYDSYLKGNLLRGIVKFQLVLGAD